MTVEAKPPIRRSSNAGGVLVVLVALALFVPLVLVAGVTLYWLTGFPGREAHSSAPAVYYDTVAVEYEPAISGEFEARISAAQQIQDPTERDEAFAILAAKHGSAAYEANEALHRIQDPVRRDGAAWEAAKRFSQQSSPQEALQMVDRMTDPKNRDSALRAIATGEWPDVAPGLGGMETSAEAIEDETTIDDGGLH